MASPSRDPDRHVSRLRAALVRAVSTALGIADAARLEHVATAMDAALSEFASELDARLERAERLAAVGQVSASAAHELRNPLSVIETSAFIVAERAASDDRVTHHMRRIAEQVALASGVVSDMLDVARGRTPITTAVDIAAIARAAVAQVPCPREANVVVDIAPDLPPAAADARRVQQVLTNLVRNALEATECAGRVQVRAVRDGAAVRISVIDDGPGLSDATLLRLFEPLFTTKAEGTGLGLALSRKIAREHGGDLVARNLPSGGACFEVTLPVADAGVRT